MEPSWFSACNENESVCLAMWECNRLYHQYNHHILQQRIKGAHVTAI
jgi:hypothetical protein